MPRQGAFLGFSFWLERGCFNGEQLAANCRSNAHGSCYGERSARDPHESIETPYFGEADYGAAASDVNWLLDVFIRANKAFSLPCWRSAYCRCTFSIVLIWTSKFEVRDGAIYLKRSKAFAYLLIGLLVLRVAFRIVMGQELNPEELSGMFFLLAYGMLLPWRVAMLVRYVKLKRDSDKVATYKP